MLSEGGADQSAAASSSMMPSWMSARLNWYMLPSSTPAIGPAVATLASVMDAVVGTTLVVIVVVGGGALDVVGGALDVVGVVLVLVVWGALLVVGSGGGCVVVVWGFLDVVVVGGGGV